jgi:hypothetical protein
MKSAAFPDFSDMSPPIRPVPAIDMLRAARVEAFEIELAVFGGRDPAPHIRAVKVLLDRLISANGEW